MKDSRTTRRLSRRFLLLGVSLIVAFIVLELGVRLIDWRRGTTRMVTYDRTLGWRLKPDTSQVFQGDEGDYTVQINSHGLRDRDYPFEKPSGVFRILVLGDSYTFGLGGVEQDATFTEVMERQFDHVEIINAAVFGYGPDQQYLYLVNEGLKYQPDLVLQCFFANDEVEPFLKFHPVALRPKCCLAEGDDSDVKIYPPKISWWHALSHYSHTLGHVERFLVSVIPRELIPRDYSDHEKQELLRRLIRKTAAACQDTGAEYTAIYFPVAGAFEEGLVQRAARQLHEEEGLNYLDLMPPMYYAVRERPTDPSPYLPIDLHFSTCGHRLVAEWILEYLDKQRLLPAGTG